MSEFDHQCALFEWARTPSVLLQYPELKLLEGSMNGIKLTIGQAKKAKAAGMLKGSHDVKLPIARGGYIGLSIELKYGKNRATTDQKEIASLLQKEGHFVIFCWDWEEAKRLIIDYLNE